MDGYGSQRVRQEMIVPKVAPSVDGSVRELVWIPLDDQNKLQIVDENNVIRIKLPNNLPEDKIK